MSKFNSIVDLRDVFAKAFEFAFFPEDDKEQDDDDGKENEENDDDNNGGEGGENDDDDDDDDERLKQKLADKKLAKENARRRKENRDLQSRIKELEDEKKSDSDKLKEQADLVPKLQTKVDELLLENAVLLSADEYEVNDRELLLLLVAKSGKVKIEDGEVEGLDDAIKEIKKKKPRLFGRSDDDGVKEKKNGAKESGTNGASGRATNEGKNSGSGPDVESLRKKYPALRR